MKVAPTLDGRLRLDLESEVDRLVLDLILSDARSAGGLADRLGTAMDDDPARTQDWCEFVRPELQSGFDGQLATIEKALATIDTEPATLFIPKDDAEAWYGGLNQARLALEDHHQLSQIEPDELPPTLRSAWFRAQFYLQLQTLLLQFLMR